MRQRSETIYQQLDSGVGTSPAGLLGRSGGSPSGHVRSLPSEHAQLCLLSGADQTALRETIQRLRRLAPVLSNDGLRETCALSVAQPAQGPARAALVVNDSQELVNGLERLDRWLAGGRVRHQRDNIFLGSALDRVRIGFLFPGQGAPVHLSGGAFRRRFYSVDTLYAQGHLPGGGNSADTGVAQPAIVTASLGGLRLLKELGIEAEVAVGHSLGELTALHWAGAWDEVTTLRIAQGRGRVMGELGAPTGAMAGIGVDAERVRSILNGEKVVIAGYNSPRQTVISGEAEEVRAVVIRAQRKGWPAIGLPVLHAFHSSHVAGAAPKLLDLLAGEPAAPLKRPVASTITANWLNPNTNLSELLVRQLTSPVRFSEAIQLAQSKEINLWIEVGPGRILGGLMADLVETPVVSMDASGDSISGLLAVVAAAFVTGFEDLRFAIFDF